MNASNENRQIKQDEKWKDLAGRAQEGDTRSYNKLLQDIAPYIRNYLAGGLANPDWADDITQEVLISVHKSLKTYSPALPFRPWLMAIVNFRRTDFLRKHYAARGDKQTPLENMEFQKNYVTDSPYAGELKDIEGALDELPEKQREVFRLMKIEGYSAQEVAKRMGMNVSAVKVSAHRTANKLKAKLG